jgi:hypothetical protein
MTTHYGIKKQWSLKMKQLALPCRRQKESSRNETLHRQQSRNAWTNSRLWYSFPHRVSKLRIGCIDWQSRPSFNHIEHPCWVPTLLLKMTSFLASQIAQIVENQMMFHAHLFFFNPLHKPRNWEYYDRFLLCNAEWKSNQCNTKYHTLLVNMHSRKRWATNSTPSPQIGQAALCIWKIPLRANSSLHGTLSHWYLLVLYFNKLFCL